jgi:nitroimidazol reductase NimA-like FMN-containing flavoprotein (pyridoxamine 5'-phosphate oxidase superfamily)
MDVHTRRPAFRGYGVPASDRGMLGWSWAEERLVQARNYWVATTRPDGRPHSMPVWGLWLDDAFIFGSGRDSAKARNLASNPAIVVHLESGDETVIIEGRAEQVLDEQLERRIDIAYGSKYDWQPDPTDPTPWFAVRPRRGYAWTERGYPTDATQFDFAVDASASPPLS